MTLPRRRVARAATALASSMHAADLRANVKLHNKKTSIGPSSKVTLRCKRIFQVFQIFTEVSCKCFIWTLQK